MDIPPQVNTDSFKHPAFQSAFKTTTEQALRDSYLKQTLEHHARKLAQKHGVAFTTGVDTTTPFTVSHATALMLGSYVIGATLTSLTYAILTFEDSGPEGFFESLFFNVPMAILYIPLLINTVLNIAHDVLNSEGRKFQALATLATLGVITGVLSLPAMLGLAVSSISDLHLKKLTEEIIDPLNAPFFVANSAGSRGVGTIDLVERTIKAAFTTGDKDAGRVNYAQRAIANATPGQNLQAAIVSYKDSQPEGGKQHFWNNLTRQDVITACLWIISIFGFPAYWLYLSKGESGLDTFVGIFQSGDSHFSETDTGDVFSVASGGTSTLFYMYSVKELLPALLALMAITYNRFIKPHSGCSATARTVLASGFMAALLYIAYQTGGGMDHASDSADVPSWFPFDYSQYMHLTAGWGVNLAGGAKYVVKELRHRELANTLPAHLHEAKRVITRAIRKAKRNGQNININDIVNKALSSILTAVEEDTFTGLTATYSSIDSNKAKTLLEKAIKSYFKKAKAGTNTGAQPLTPVEDFLNHLGLTSDTTKKGTWFNTLTYIDASLINDALQDQLNPTDIETNTTCCGATGASLPQSKINEIIDLLERAARGTPGFNEAYRKLVGIPVTNDDAAQSITQGFYPKNNDFDPSNTGVAPTRPAMTQEQLQAYLAHAQQEMERVGFTTDEIAAMPASLHIT